VANECAEALKLILRGCNWYLCISVNATDLMDALGRTGGGVLLVGNGVAVNHTFAR